jgi:hypothetical protein
VRLPIVGFADAILRPNQKQLLGAFSRSSLAGSFSLTGGTALAAFHLGHRVSEDLDFFTERDVPVEAVHMLRARFLGGTPPLGGLEMRTAVDPANVGRFYSETARRWVRESLPEE